MGISNVCQNCKKEHPSTRSRSVYTKNYRGSCRDSFCFASCDLEACRPLQVTVCDACAQQLTQKDAKVIKIGTAKKSKRRKS